MFDIEMTWKNVIEKRRRMGKDKIRIVVLERGAVGADVSVEGLRELGALTAYTNTRPEDIPERVADADIVVANKLPINERTIGGATRLRLVCEFATGYDNIDLAYCKSRGIAVANVSDYSTDAVVQHTMALALSLTGNLSYYDHYVKSGAYAAQDNFSHYGRVFYELAGKNWGIVGMGHIGKGVARVACALGCEVLAYSSSGQHDIAADADVRAIAAHWSREAQAGADAEQAGCGMDASGAGCGVRQVDFPQLLRESDVLSLHCPLTEQTRHLVDAAALRQMKPTAVLVNVARGAVVDNAALAAALTDGVIAAAGLDVMEQEPISPSSPLLSVPDDGRLILTPHMAWASLEARTRVVEEVCRNIAAYLRGERRNRVD